jgi:hypothetical protein
MKVQQYQKPKKIGTKQGLNMHVVTQKWGD